mgnify:CR=1 FL=1
MTDINLSHNNLGMLCILGNTLAAVCIVHLIAFIIVYYTLIMHLKPSGIDNRFRWLHLVLFPGMEQIFFAVRTMKTD